MNERVKSLASEARRLSPEERAELLDDILASLNPIDEAWTAAWSAEAERRWAAYKAGGMAAIDADDVLADIEARLARQRAR